IAPLLESKPIDRAPAKIFIQFVGLMFAPFQRLNISHTARSLSSPFQVILAAESNIIRLSEWWGCEERVNQGRGPSSLPSCMAWVRRQAPSEADLNCRWLFPGMLVRAASTVLNWRVSSTGGSKDSPWQIRRKKKLHSRLSTGGPSAKRAKFGRRWGGGGAGP